MALEFVSGMVVSSLLQEVIDRMKAVAADTINLVYSSDIATELKNLESTYGAAQETLTTVDGWDLINNKHCRNWIADIRGACYDAEDYIEHLRFQILSKIGDANILSALFTKVVASHKLRNLQSNLHDLITKFDSYHIARRSEERQHNPTIKTEPAALPVEASFKRTKDKHDIVRFFLQTMTESSMMNVLITGMFGIGKTTLAQAVMNEPQIKGHFHHRIWVPVSREFNLAETLMSIIADLQEEHDKYYPVKLSVIISIFEDLCIGRRILVILDDLSNFRRPQQDWKEFEKILCNCSCAKFGIIITTRNPKVGSTVTSLSSFPISTHYLQQMSDEDCASLVLHKTKSVPLYKLSKRYRCGKTTTEANTLEIAQKLCKGLPLVADIIGYHLAVSPDIAASSLVLSEDLWDMPEFIQQIFPAFRLNYSDLTLFLRNCLPYFSLFPENYNFYMHELIWLWLAEGFIGSQAVGYQYLECPSIEELGRYAFDEVFSRSILQIHCPLLDQEPRIYTMHEFIRRYAQYIGSDMYVRIEQQLELVYMANQIRKARHISFIRSSIPSELWKDIEKSEGLRTILSLHHEFTKIGPLSRTLFVKLRWLRVLVLSRTDVVELPESLGELKHLKLLDVSETKIKELPRSTGNLYGLQVLKLNLCSQLRQLPKDISNLTHLRHLEVNIKSLILMPPHIGKLSRLRTLHAFKVGRKDGHRVTELKNMKYLKGSICLTNLENVRDETEAKEAELSYKPLLKRVELEWKRNSTNQSLAERILAALEPHDNLEELQVNGYVGAQFPSWLSSPECNLTSIHILKCEHCTMLPALGELEHLKVLKIEEMHRLKYIDHHFMGIKRCASFISLESLTFQYLTSLVKWEGLQANQMPKLQKLFIADCPNLTSIPPLNLLNSLEHLEITACPALEALPEEGLPSSLEMFSIIQCDLLKQRCQPEHGADWEKIKTVPNMFIDFERISSPGP